MSEFDQIVAGIELEDPIERIREENRALGVGTNPDRSDPALVFELFRREMDLPEDIGAISISWGKTGGQMIAYSYETSLEAKDWIVIGVIPGHDWGEAA